MQFDPGKRYGVTGANGAGKSTLLEMLSRPGGLGRGGDRHPAGLRVGVLEQNHFAYDEQRILDTVIAGKAELWAAMVREGDAPGRRGRRRRRRASRRARRHHRRVRRLHAPRARPPSCSWASASRPRSTPSRCAPSPAGYKLRVLIAKVLFGRPDVLLLDEPTNHLDLESIHWLEPVPGRRVHRARCSSCRTTATS